MENTTQAKTTRTGTKRSPASTPSYEAIQFRAYELFVQRGADGGNDLEDWLQAERELGAKKPARKARAA